MIGYQCLKAVWGDIMIQKRVSHQEVINEYIEICLVLRETTLNGDFKKGNAEGRKIIKLFKTLENDIELAESALPKLLHNENVVTKAKAAAHCLSLNINVEEALMTLKSIANDETSGLFGFNAKMTLKVYHEQGFLKVYPSQNVSRNNSYE